MGKFIIHPTPTGFTFHLKADNYETICTSEVYRSEEACKHGIESVRHNCGSHVEDQTKEGFETLTHPKYEIYHDSAQHFRFRLKARNGEEIAASAAYTTKAACEKGIESIRHNAPEAEVVKEEPPKDEQ